MKYTEQDLKDEYEQAVKRRGKLYADGYVEGLKDAKNQALTIPVVSVPKGTLIDFYNYIQKNDIDHDIPHRIERMVEIYLKSINAL